MTRESRHVGVFQDGSEDGAGVHPVETRRDPGSRFVAAGDVPVVDFPILVIEHTFDDINRP